MISWDIFADYSKFCDWFQVAPQGNLGASAVSAVSGEQAAAAWLTSALNDVTQDPNLKRQAEVRSP